MKFLFTVICFWFCLKGQSHAWIICFSTKPEFLIDETNDNSVLPEREQYRENFLCLGTYDYPHRWQTDTEISQQRESVEIFYAVYTKTLPIDIRLDLFDK